MNIYQHTQQVIDTVKAKTNRVLLFYSCGKDSIALLHWCAQNFDEVVCVFMYFVKDLEHINKSGLFCTPQNTRILKLSDIIQSVRLETQIEYVFLGMKQSDSMNRRIMLRQYEMQAISPTKLVYPFSLWKDKDVLRYISNNRLPKPIQYGNKKSNGITFDLDVYLYLREHYPNDLQKILDVYPLSEKILFDYDQKNKNTEGTIQAK